MASQKQASLRCAAVLRDPESFLRMMDAAVQCTGFTKRWRNVSKHCSPAERIAPTCDVRRPRPLSRMLRLCRAHHDTTAKESAGNKTTELLTVILEEWDLNG